MDLHRFKELPAFFKLLDNFLTIKVQKLYLFILQQFFTSKFNFVMTYYGLYKFMFVFHVHTNYVNDKQKKSTFYCNRCNFVYFSKNRPLGRFFLVAAMSVPNWGTGGRLCPLPMQFFPWALIGPQVT